ncbi:MAG: ATP-binding protein [Candidatus Lokiarchaeota archaeon]|nr:ATP-binding protein [Candidatus Lokiarchaeota archaeon]
MIKRILEQKIIDNFNSRKAIIITGPRQVGKTTLIKSIFADNKDVLWLNGDETDVQKLFENMSSTRMRAILGKNKFLVIDEAQRINNIGLALKIIIDEIPKVQLIATGSSSFDLANKINEPLTGGKFDYMLFPLSYGEMVTHHGLLEEKRLIPHRLVFGYYPDVVNGFGNEKRILKELSDSYLYKDILVLEQIKKTDKLIKLLQAIAYQVGSQVSYTEISQTCGLDNKTVEKYISSLEKCYVVFRLSSFNRNLRSELKTSKKIYFYDNGIRNAIIANFSQIENRQDVGMLWENFLISERMKKIHYSDIWCNYWFWRTKEQKEIDLLEESDGVLSAYEFKWNPNSKVKKVKQFLNAYPTAKYKIITPENVEDFLL